MQLLTKNSVGNKILMAVSGQVMILFIIIHAAGNTTVFFKGLNAYAEKLHSLPVLVWMTRTVMVTVFLIHVFFSIKLTLENRKAKPVVYAVRKKLRTTVASKNMIWTGITIGAFLVYHLLHFTLQLINPELSASMNVDAAGRPDVAGMVIAGFQDFSTALIYGAAMVALVLHLMHGIQSSFQSLGLGSDNTQPIIAKTGSAAAFLIFIGYFSIPLIIFLGIMKG